MLFRSKRSSEKEAVVITLGSGSVSVAQAKIEHQNASKSSEPIHEAITLRSEIKKEFSDDRDLLALLGNAARALDEALIAIAKHLPPETPQPQLILLVLGAPWVVSQTRTIVYRKPKPFTLTHAVLNELLRKEVDYVLTHDMEQFGVYGTNGIIIEKQISRISINGYESNDPFGKHISDLEVTLTLTVSPKQIMDRFTETVHRHYGARKMGFASAVMANFIAIRDHVFHKDATKIEAWIADIHEHITDITFIKDGFVLYHHSFAYGSDSVLKEFEQLMHLPESEARSLLETYAKGALAPEKAVTVSAAVEHSRNEWMHRLEELFDSHTYGLCAPSVSYVIAPEQLRAFFVDAIQGSDFLKHACATDILHTSALTPQEFGPLFTPATDIHNAIASVFVARIV